MSNLGRLSSHLINPSFHPTLSLHLQPTIPSSINTAQCQAGLLIHLPSGVFYDPHTSPSQGSLLTSTKDGLVELEGAVGYSLRRPSTEGRGQWWERQDDSFPTSPGGGGDGGGGLDLNDIFTAALKQKAQEVVSEEPIKVSLGEDRKARVKSRGKVGGQQRQEYKEERTTVVVPVDVNELLKADGWRTDVGLHVRYHPPLESAVGLGKRDSLPSINGPITALFHDIIPSPTQMANSLLRLIGQTPTQPFKSTPTDHLSITLPPPTVFLSCPGPRSSTTLFPSSHAHLEPQFDANVVAHAKATSQLRLKVPVPRAVLLAPVQVGTMAVVLGAVAVLVAHLLLNVVPVLEAVERAS